MPARSTGALCMMVPDAAVMAAPMPAPSTLAGYLRDQRGVVAEQVAAHAGARDQQRRNQHPPAAHARQHPATRAGHEAASDSGRMYSAACIGDMPCTSCRRWLKTSSMPSSAAAANTPWPRPS